MDANRFDRLARSLTTSRSRRGALATLLGGTLGLLGLAETAARKGNREAKCQPRCDECEKCTKGKKGKCQPRPNGTPCTAGTCQGGSCTPPPSPTCTNPSSCASDAECCGADNCSCGEPHVCVQAGSLGTGACCKSNDECLQQCVVQPSHGVCCNPEFPESCVCQNCPGCPPERPEVCAGACVAPCPEGSARNPGTCGCCLTEDQAGTPETCCSGQVVGGDCRGLGGNETCTFDAQCLTNSCGPGGCGSP